MTSQANVVNVTEVIAFDKSTSAYSNPAPIQPKPATNSAQFIP